MLPLKKKPQIHPVPTLFFCGVLGWCPPTMVRASFSIHWLKCYPLPPKPSQIHPEIMSPETWAFLTAVKQTHKINPTFPNHVSPFLPYSLTLNSPHFLPQSLFFSFWVVQGGWECKSVGTQDFEHSRPALYHWAAPQPSFIFNLDGLLESLSTYMEQ